MTVLECWERGHHNIGVGGWVYGVWDVWVCGLVGCECVGSGM